MWPWHLSMTLNFNGVLKVVEVHVHAKFHRANCSDSWVIVVTSFFAQSRNGEKSENVVLWPWPLTYNLKFSGFHAKFHRPKCSGTADSKNKEKNRLFVVLWRTATHTPYASSGFLTATVNFDFLSPRLQDLTSSTTSWEALQKHKCMEQTDRQTTRKHNRLWRRLSEVGEGVKKLKLWMQ